jgi:lipoate-protein ligase A
MRWRLLRFQRNGAAFNMALDEAILTSVASGRSPPTIRLYGWRPDAVTVGRFQEIDEVVDLPACDSMGVEVIRRITGGGAVFHSSAGEVTYSLMAPEAMIGMDINATYRDVCNRVVRALKRIGIVSTFVPINDIVTEGRKISGSAQTRRSGAVLQHGTIIYDLDRERMFRALKVNETKLSDKGIASPGGRVTSVLEHSTVSFGELIEALEAEMVLGLDHLVGEVGKEELTLAADAERRYSSEEWKLKR